MIIVRWHGCHRFAVLHGCNISETKDFCYFSSLKSKMPIQVALKLQRQLKAVLLQEINYLKK
ncbi:hypothetical protein EA736_10320 [Acinetobacter baumannii]|nr:hypothetical protein B9X74_02010 [Acinetobacter baumannii]OTM85046.1 hypothetical protein B9X67_09415 [Acinetobacter baumannii]OTS34116.1 hypothetical protein CAT05_15375 [Acinetobacter baumannii]OTU03539.1 hypothetical protein CAT66_10880 [Acinetobacter baumannii]PUV10194.1 hypothetical protein DCD95_02535 [Acinetobacter baumannii]